MRNILKLSQPQLDRISEIFGNITVAWFSIGFIAPLFIKPVILFDLVISIVLSLLMSLLFLYLSLTTIKRRYK